MIHQYSPERIAARMEIQDAVYRWARGVDRRDWDSLYDVFHPDATDRHGIYDGPIDGLICWLKERHKGISQCMHFIGNVFIEFTGEKTALCESCVIGYHVYGDAPFDVKAAILGEKMASERGDIVTMVIGRYVDEFEQRNGRWKVARRNTIFEHMEAEVEGDGPKLNPKWLIQSRDANDMIMQKRREWGLAK